MGGLKHTLNIGAESLYATRQGVDTAGHNIANANTEGFSRQRINLEQRIPSETRNVIIGNGVFVKNITRAHDKYLEKQLNMSNQDLGRSEAKLESMKPLEEIYSPQLNASVSEEIGAFFLALQELSSFPEETIVRSNVLERADSLVHTFKRVENSLKRFRNDLNDRIEGETVEISTMIKDIAKLNTAIQTLEAGDTREASDLLDQQDLLLRKLTKKIDINYYRGDRGMVVVRGPQETLLVERGHAANVQVTKDVNSPEGMYDVIIDKGSAYKPISIMNINKKGRLAGLIDVRDNIIPDLIKKNNELAFVLGHSLNAVHRRGYGVGEFKESTNRDFFTLSDDLNRAVETIDVDWLIREDQAAIAAALTPSAPGDNINVNEMLRLKEVRMMSNGDATFDEYYASTVGLFGLDLVRAEHIKEADTTLNNDLLTRHDALKGVSMDEEAINLMKWQANFTASSRVITTIDEMFETVLSLKR
ncbi:flagellar hook-associated protein FlgK [Pseudobacteriovorax antillogorgiicola]|uniref:Flagellar hook-associated protein 1 n=1 Tax=Pseudobacteriovorax antillogorgiicola TaxID=1513793 RepID=A0A1Y6B4R6_9BACT|nr:flagellar hook-associated protein FlgK [Pseudobacteriovorax antillogorgiicola]TCS59532.1 flagellar hook-associated protein 1 FlgK [Pseudobacteriovorax antillogorgiicola]SME87820.1 flagellar hook-associated protein 1 FlgK [Pseudobacteriovorax antillogorgiicola]